VSYLSLHYPLEPTSQLHSKLDQQHFFLPEHWCIIVYFLPYTVPTLFLVDSEFLFGILPSVGFWLLLVSFTVKLVGQVMKRLPPHIYLLTHSEILKM
jgi:hypothetical protein